jgi:hypothetical protein
MKTLQTVRRARRAEGKLVRERWLGKYLRIGMCFSVKRHGQPQPVWVRRSVEREALLSP